MYQTYASHLHAKGRKQGVRFSITKSAHQNDHQKLRLLKDHWHSSTPSNAPTQPAVFNAKFITDRKASASHAILQISMTRAVRSTPPAYIYREVEDLSLVEHRFFVQQPHLIIDCSISLSSRRCRVSYRRYLCLSWSCHWTAWGARRCGVSALRSGVDDALDSSDIGNLCIA